MDNLRKILGVGQHSSFQEIKSAYRSKALLHHPDRGGNAAFMQELNKAFEILSSKEKTAEFASDQDATIDALAVPLCACGCFECSSFVEQGCQPGTGGCESCQACDLPSRHFARLMSEDFVLAWELRTSSDLGPQLLNLKQELLDRFVPLVLPEGNALVEIHGLSKDSSCNGLHGTLGGMVADGDGRIRRVVRVWNEQSGAFKSLRVLPKNLHAVTDQGAVPGFARLLADAVGLLAPLAAQQSVHSQGIVAEAQDLEAQDLTQEDCLRDPLHVACVSASQVAALACAGLPAKSGIYLRIMGKSLKVLAATKSTDSLDGLGAYFLRVAHAAMEAAACVECEGINVEAETEELFNVLLNASRKVLLSAIEKSTVSTAELRKWEEKLLILRLKQKEHDLAHQGLCVEDDGLKAEIDAVVSKKNEARSAVQDSISSASDLVCMGLVEDSVIQDAVFSALKEVAPKGFGWMQKLLKVAVSCAEKPAETLGAVNSVLWSCIGDTEMDSIYNFLGKLAASMATRGWLQTIHKDSFSAFRAGRKGNALSPPSQKLFPHLQTTGHRKALEKLEERVLEEWKADRSFHQAYLTALRYIDFSRVAETTVETVVCFQNAALWLHCALGLASKERLEESAQYAIKECILLICRDTCSIAAKHFHPGMQAFVFWQAVSLLNCNMSAGKLGDESDLRQFEGAMKNWLYAVRLCPVGVPSHILVCEASLLDCSLGKLHVAYIDCLASTEASQAQSSVPPIVLEHARFETYATGVSCFQSDKGESNAESLRLKALDAALANHGLTRESAQQLQHATYARRNDHGWRTPGESKDGQVEADATMLRIHELLDKLKTRRLTTDPVPQLARRLGRLGRSEPGMNRQIVRLLQKVKKRRKQLSLQNGLNGQTHEEIVDELEQAFEEQHRATGLEPRLKSR